MDLVRIFMCVVFVGGAFGMLEQGPLLNTTLGVISGKSIDAVFKGVTHKVHLYAGLPYAKPPVGEKRFKKPIPFGQLPESPFNATTFAPSCAQRDWAGIGVYSDEEDCLYLNIHVPADDIAVHANRTSENLAVMIFVHGGGYSRGGSSKYTAQVLAAVGNVIVVTINYRLGLLGFANTGDGLISGNLGLWDQRLAFQWVHDNIAEFGGDPARVTLFGESAGSVSVFLHALYPPNKDLFHNIIAESGSPQIPYRTDNLPSLKTIAGSLGCDTETTETIVTCLKTAQTTTLVSKLDDLSGNMVNYLMFGFIPTIDGEYIKDDYYSGLVLRSRYESVPEIEFLRSLNVITGVNSDEGAMFLFMTGQENLETLTVSSADFRASHVPNIFNLLFNVQGLPVPSTLLDIVAHEYTDWSHPKEFRGMFMKLMADLLFYFHGREVADVHANSSESKTYFYSFEPSVSRHVLPTPSWVDGANHMDELLSVFGYGLDAWAPANETTPDWELDMAERVMTYWSNFAKTRDPNVNDSQVTGNLPIWPQFELGTPKYIAFNQEDEIRHDDIYLGELKFWREIVPSTWLALLSNDCDQTNHAATSFPTYTNALLLAILLSTIHSITNQIQ